MSPISAFTARRACHLLLGAAILSATVLAGFPVAPDAHAATGACRSEPVAILSNGYAIDMDTTIEASSDDVQYVNYTLKLPSGVSVVGKPVDDSNTLGAAQDTYSVSSSGPAGSYSVGVQVSMRSTGTPVNVSASMVLVTATKAKIRSNTVSGHSSQQLWMSVSG